MIRLLPPLGEHLASDPESRTVADAAEGLLFIDSSEGETRPAFDCYHSDDFTDALLKHFQLAKSKALNELNDEAHAKR